MGFFDDPFKKHTAKSIEANVDLGSPSMELKGNSAQGNEIKRFGRGNGRFAAYNRDNSKIMPVDGSEATPVEPFTQGKS